MKPSHSKIYLSKSNLASVEDVRQIREYLSRLGYAIVEHEGGSYDEAQLKTAEIMIMVGYAEDNGDDIVEVGKGQYQQLEYRESTGFDYSNNLYFTQWLGDGRPELYQVETSSVINESNWKRGFGEIQFIDEGFIDAIAREPLTRTTDPMTMEAVERMEKELPEEYKCTNGMKGDDGDVDIFDPRSRWKHLACYTLLH